MDFLNDILSDDQISTTDEQRDEHSADFGTPEELKTLPDVVVWPHTASEISEILSRASDRGIPVTPYALGTSLEGNATPVEGGISLNMTEMDNITEFRPHDFQVDLQPGVVGSDINEKVNDRGLFFPPLPSSGDYSTIGGMIANDASGMYTVKYGEVADWVLALEVVLPNGDIISTGSKAIKTSSGYNLKDLFIGSEGTLGIVTEITLQLTGLPEQKQGGRAVFNTLDDAASAITDAISSGLDVAAIELIDSLSAEMSNDYLETTLPDSPMVFVEFHTNHGIEEEIDFARLVFEDHDVEDFQMAESQARMDELWEARKELALAVLEYDPDLMPLHPGDVTVPISKYPDIIKYAKELSDEHGFMVPCFGHGGDGNLHYTVLVDMSDSEHVKTGEMIYEKIVEKAMELGGTSTGEHGIGVGKQKYLEREHGEAAVRAMQSVKDALDPSGILNPGKVFPGSNPVDPTDILSA